MVGGRTSATATVPAELREQQLAFFDMLTAGEPPNDSYLEFRSKTPWGMHQEFVPSRAHRTAQALIAARGQETDTYVGVAPRTRQEGTRDAVAHVHALWADVDTPEAVAALERFEAAPSMVVASGGPRCLHAYWSLWPPVGPDEAEAANRRIAHALGADMQATDAARILRPPGTFNFKTDTPKPVEVEYLNVEVYTLEHVVGELPDPPNGCPAGVALVRHATSVPPATHDDPLLTIPPAAYVEALSGRVVGRDGKVPCPFHDDSTPSLHVYDEPERGWTCFGCGRGGTIIDFGAALYGIEPRGRGFHVVRERLERDLLAVAA